MRHFEFLAMVLIGLSVSGCFADPWREPYEGLEAKPGPPRNIDSLPPVKRGEIWLTIVRQANGTGFNADGTFENEIGGEDQCLFAFKVDPNTRRMVSWRFASKGSPDACYSHP